MPLQSPPRKISDAENRLRVLCCLDSLGMVTLEQLWPFVAQLELMEYMPLCIYVDELKTSGALAVGTHVIEGTLYLTNNGQQTLAMFGDLMPQTERESIQSAAPAYLTQLHERQHVRAVYENAEPGWYRVSCFVREGDVPTLLLRVSTRKRNIAAGTMKRFRGCASQIMMLLYTIPTDEPDAVKAALPPLAKAAGVQEAMEVASRGKRAICALSKREHYAVIGCTGQEAMFILALLAPSRESAEDWSAAAAAHADHLGDLLSRLLFHGGKH